ncbi:MAG: alpha/beta hydrolase [Candidatus Dadabacteria bacterium]|nr:MAG: alpha/beta hydrolase [Candidatus Dadabacteria bacterium]
MKGKKTRGAAEPLLEGEAGPESTLPVGRRVDVGGLYLHVDDWGGRPPGVVFAHPTGFMGAIWKPVIDAMRGSGFDGEIVTFDQRGHGRSAKPDSGYHWERFVEDAVALFDRLGIENAVGVGHSAGATTIGCAAARLPRAFRRLVLIDPILFDPVADAEFLRAENPLAARTRGRRLVWESREEMLASYRHRFPYDTWTEEALRVYVQYGTFDRPDGMVELWCPGRIEAQVYENAASMDVFAELSKVQVPTLLVRGEHSLSFPPERAERALATIPESRLITVEGTTHYVPMEAPDRVAQIVLAEFNA